METTLTKSNLHKSLKKYQKAAKSDLCLDLSRQSLSSVPSTAMEIAPYLQFLYLQDNAIEELPTDFFCLFLALRHLDLRQNKLVEIPVSIGSHGSLEVLLLQDNKLSVLPSELGQVPRLRKLQFSGNPLKWPPADILHGGLQAIISFLRGAFMKQLGVGNVNPIPNINYVGEGYSRSADGDMESHLHVFLPKKEDAVDDNQPMTLLKNHDSESASTLDGTGHWNSTGLKEYRLLGDQLKKSKNYDRPSVRNVLAKHRKSPSLKPQLLPGHALAIMNGQCFPLGYKKRSTTPSTSKIYKTLLQKLWLNQLKYTLESQDHVLQKQKTSEALRQWRQEAKLLQQSKSLHKWAGLNFPYDFDLKYLQMVSRTGLQMSKNESLEEKGHVKPNNISDVKTIGLQEKIDQILQSFNAISMSRSMLESNTSEANPSTRRQILAEEMKRISTLQKTVQSLRLST